MRVPRFVVAAALAWAALLVSCLAGAATPPAVYISIAASPSDLPAMRSLLGELLQPYAIEPHVATLDIIVTPDDEYVFLECNADGAWLGVEERTGMKISAAVAELLMYPRPDGSGWTPKR